MKKESNTVKDGGQQINCHVASLAWKGARARLWLPKEFCTYLREQKVNYIMLLNDGMSGKIVLKPLRNGELQKYYEDKYKEEPVKAPKQDCPKPIETTQQYIPQSDIYGR